MTSEFTDAYGLTVSSVSGNFQEIETVTTGGGVTATVLYAQGSLLVVGTFAGGSLLKVIH